jgi:hypothetical protein
MNGVIAMVFLAFAEQFQELRRAAKRTEMSSLPDGRADSALWRCSIPFLRLLQRRICD